MKSKYFKYYQPNKKDKKDQYGDCTIRALSKALNISWVEAFDLMIPYCRQEQCSNIFDTPITVRKRIVCDLGFTYHGVSNAAGTKRPTVAEFAKNHPTGTYILQVAHHVVACVDGYFYDTWDSGWKSLYGYYERL